MDSVTKHKGEDKTSPLVFKVINLNTKIKQGYYSFDESKCFCGHSEGQIVATKDRYGIFYSLKLCDNCGILYSDKIMTADSMEKFYKSDYRDIYDYGLNRNDEFNSGKEVGESIKQLLYDYDADYNVVFDIGCNMGQHLSAFEDKETYGVDYCKESIGYGKDKGLSVFHGGIEVLEKLNKKADVIILSHVLEHFIDIEKELDRISKLLNPDGFLYVGVLGSYSNYFPAIVQNAHNWQFTSNSLTYSMECCGWQPWHCDSTIHSLWKYVGKRRDKKNICKNEVKEIVDGIFSDKPKLPQIANHCKFTLRDRKRNIKNSLSYKLPDISELFKKHSGSEAIIISGGPTVNGYLDKIRHIHDNGGIIFCIERMVKWLLDNGIVPDYAVVMDMADDVSDSFKVLHPDINYIVHTNCNDDLYKILNNSKVNVFSSEQLGVNHGDILKDNGYESVAMINTWGSISLACFSVAMYLGIKNIHVFGFDCHVTEQFYADGITGEGTSDDERIEISVNGQDFISTTSYISFARQFAELYYIADRDELLEGVKIYGDSLAKAMLKIDIDGDKPKKKGRK